MPANLTLVFDDDTAEAEAAALRGLRLEHSLNPSAARAIDVGCAAGRLVLALSDSVQFAVGLDISLQEVTRGRQRQVAAGKTNVAFVVGDLQHPPFRDASFDYVVSRFALHHTDLETSLPALRRLVRRGGRLLLRDIIAWFPSMQKHRWWHLPSVFLNALGRSWGAGPLSAYRYGRFLLQPEAMRHVTTVNRLLSPRRYRALHRRHLPGCRFVRGGGLLYGNAPVVIWDRARDGGTKVASANCIGLAVNSAVEESVELERPTINSHRVLLRYMPESWLS